jgi:hypothetical protein
MRANLAAMLMHEEFATALRAAKTPQEFLKVIDDAEAERNAEQAAKANKPKAERKSGADPEKQAAMAARAEAALAWLIANPGEYTASDVKKNVPEMETVTIMQVGSDLKSLLPAGSVKCEKKDGKNYWSFAG